MWTAATRCSTTFNSTIGYRGPFPESLKETLGSDALAQVGTTW